VSQDFRGQLLGKQIVNKLLALAREKGMKEVYLLTNTAFLYFLKFGFNEAIREQVPEAIKASSEFSSVCPSSAHVMKLVL
jgi:amino-acid N-acetyltransferase